MNSRLLSCANTSFFCKPVGALQGGRAASYGASLIGVVSPSPPAANAVQLKHRREAIAKRRAFIRDPTLHSSHDAFDVVNTNRAAVPGARLMYSTFVRSAEAI